MQSVCPIPTPSSTIPAPNTRFVQLNTSVELGLWQEALRSVEDIHTLLAVAKNVICSAMMADYYEKLTKIFLRAVMRYTTARLGAVTALW